MRPVEEQARGDDATADLSSYSRADCSGHQEGLGVRERVAHSLVHAIAPHLVLGLEEFEYRSNRRQRLVGVQPTLCEELLD